jgi:hypothetical protein
VQDTRLQFTMQSNSFLAKAACNQTSSSQWEAWALTVQIGQWLSALITEASISAETDMHSRAFACHPTESQLQSKHWRRSRAQTSQVGQHSRRTQNSIKPTSWFARKRSGTTSPTTPRACAAGEAWGGSGRGSYAAGEGEGRARSGNCWMFG